MFERKKVADAAQSIVDHLLLVDNVKALQTAQKELADAMAALGRRITDIECAMAVLKSEVKYEALKETQQIINAVQGSLNQRIENVSIKVALLDGSAPTGTNGVPRLIPASNIDPIDPPA